MNKIEILTLIELITKFQATEAPCRGGACRGYQQCEFGVNECYGEICMIDTISEVLRSGTDE